MKYRKNVAMLLAGAMLATTVIPNGYLGAEMVLAAEESTSERISAIYNELMKDTRLTEYYEVSHSADTITTKDKDNGAVCEYKQVGDYLTTTTDDTDDIHLAGYSEVYDALLHSIGMEKDRELFLGLFEAAALNKADSKYVKVEDAEGKKRVSVYDAGKFDIMSEIKDLYIDDEVAKYVEGGKEAVYGKFYKFSEGSSGFYTLYLGEYGELDEDAYKSLVSLVRYVKPAGYEEFLKNYTPFSGGDKNYSSGAYSVKWAPEDYVDNNMPDYKFIIFDFVGEINQEKTNQEETNQEETSDWYYDEEGDGICITGYGPGVLKGDVVIPDTIEGKKVTSIGNDAFSDCGELKSIVLPSDLWKIGEYAFNSCTGLVKVSLPDSLIQIGEGAFIGCTGLRELVIPNSVKPNTTDFCDSCENITITVPDFYKNMAKEMSEGLYGRSVIKTASGEVLYSGYNARSQQTEDGLYYYKVQENGEIEISSASSENLKEKIVIPDTIEGKKVTSISERAFAWCENLKEVTIPDSVKTLGESVFNGCRDITIIIPDAMEELVKDDAAIEKNLGDLEGNCVIKNKTGTFILKGEEINSWYWKSLNKDEVRITGTKREENKVTIPETIAGKKVTAVGPEESEDGGFYSFNQTETSNYELILPASIREITDHAFEDDFALTRITLQEGVEKIGASAFSSTVLSTLALPNTVKSIGANAFSGMYELKTLVIPDGLADTFQKDKGMGWGLDINSLNSTLTVKTVSGKVLYSAESGEGTDTKENGNAENQTSGGTNNQSTDNKETGTANNQSTGNKGTNSSAEKNTANTNKGKTTAQSATTSVVSKGVTYKVSGANAAVIAAQKSVKTVSVSNTVKIGTKTYKVTAVSANAFKNCTKLKKVTIGKNVTSIGKKAFSGCKSLKTVIIKGNVKKIGKSAFKGIKNKATFKAPKKYYKNISKKIKKSGAKKPVIKKA